MFQYKLHPNTLPRLQAITQDPAQGYVFSGPQYHYKRRAAEDVALTLAAATSLHDPNILFLEAEDQSKIKIAQVKSILDKLARTAYRQGQQRVVLVIDADKMTADAANALLKSLEEPGESVTYILTTSRVHGLLPTIRSRVQQVNFYPLESGAQYLPPRLQEEIAASSELASRHSLARSLAEQFIAGGVSKRFLAAKQAHESGLSPEVLWYVANVLRAQTLSPNAAESLAATLRAEDNLKHNINDRVSLELLALEMTV